MKHLLCVMVLIACSGCRVLKPYEKEYLLTPAMEDESVARLSGDYSTRTRPLERLAGVGTSSGSSSCPTCGGK